MAQTAQNIPRLSSTWPSVNSNVQPIPQPAQNGQNVLACLSALKNNVESLSGQRGAASNRAVTFNDLVQFGILDPSAVVSPQGKLDVTGGTGGGGTGISGPYVSSVTAGPGLTGGGTGNISLSVASQGITNSMLAPMAANTIRANLTGATAPPIDTPVSQLFTSPVMSGVPTAPTAALSTNTTQLATTAFVMAQIGASATGVTSVTAGAGLSGGGTGAVTLAVAAGGVTNTMLATMAANQLKGASVAGTPVDLTVAQVQTMLGYITGNQTITLSGDATGSGATAITTVITGLQNRPVAATAPTANQVLAWSGTQWAPATPAAGGGTITGTTANNVVAKGGAAASSITTSSITDTGAGVYIGSPVGGPAGAGSLMQTGMHVISSNTAGLAPFASQTMLQLAVGDTAAANVEINAFGTVGPPRIYFRQSRGTGAAPTATLQGDFLGSVAYIGAGGTGSGTFALGGQVFAQATEPWSTTAHGTQIILQTTAQGSIANSAALTAMAGVIIGNNVGGVDPGRGGLTLNANAAALPAAQTGTLLQIGTVDGTGTAVVTDSYGYQYGPSIILRQARGTAAALSGTLINDYIGSLVGTGRNATGAWGVGVQIYGVATQNWVSGAQGALLNFATTPSNTTSLTTAMTLDGSGNLTITGGTATKPGGGSWVAPSDRALKSTVNEWDTGLNAILALQPVSYRYRNELWNLPDGGSYIGLDANEAGAVIPELTRRVRLADGEPETSAEGALEQPMIETAALDHGPIVLALVNAVRELADEVATLKKKS